jgi:hypothetical protein
VSRLSLTQVLRPFEQGMLNLGLLAGVYTIIVGFVLLASIWLVPGRTIRTKLRNSFLCVIGAGAVLFLASRLALSVDMTEDRRNSFPLTDERALSSLSEPLSIGVHLAPEDPRYVDVRRNVLTKLQRILPNVKIRLAGERQLYGAVPTDEAYGLLEFAYGARTDTTRSTSPREILPLIYALADRRPPVPIPGTDYPGYPLVVNGQAALVWYFGALPLFVVLAWWWSRRPPKLAHIQP